MHFKRVYTDGVLSPFDSIKWEIRTVEVREENGQLIFNNDNVEVPEFWSEVATSILANKYFKRARVPNEVEKIAEDDIFPMFYRSVPKKGTEFGQETSLKQVVHRLAGTWAYWLIKSGLAKTEDDAKIFYDELCYILVNQIAAPNSPQFFNTGLGWAYGINHTDEGYYYFSEKVGKVLDAATNQKDSICRATGHACFIQKIEDAMFGHGSIYDMIVSEAKIFKKGSGSGINFSSLRGRDEMLSGGGTSSGVMSFLRIFDRSADAVKSGGTTRRAAKMVSLDIDHPEVEEFIGWKLVEEQKVAAMISGSKSNNKILNEIISKYHEIGDDPDYTHKDMKPVIRKALAHNIEINYIKRAIDLAKQGYNDMPFVEMTNNFNDDAYHTVSGQNSNNSLCITDKFLNAVKKNEPWNLVRRTDGKPSKTLSSKALWEKIVYAAWSSADPGMHFKDTMNAWNTCLDEEEIHASNPCVTGDSLVATEEGWKRIDSIVGTSQNIIGADGEVHRVNEIFPTGKKDIYLLKTQSGYELKLTGDHKVYTINRGDVAVKDLNEEDIIKLYGARFGNDSLDKDFAYTLGLSVGDGCISGETLQITMSQNEEYILDRAVNAINIFKQNNRDNSLCGRQDGVAIHKTATSSKVATGCKCVVDQFKKYANLDSGSNLKAFKDSVFNMDKNTISNILMGLFDSDGTVANYGNKSQYISLDSTSSILLKQVQLLLLSFGIKSKLYSNRRGGKTISLLPDSNRILKEYNVKECYSLRISKSSRVIFEKEIGFGHIDKSTKLKSMNNNFKCYSDKMQDKVQSVSIFDSNIDVYDLTEKNTNHFVANGILIHNCSEYIFLDNTACNLSSMRLTKFFDEDSNKFDIDKFRHVVDLITTVLELTVVSALLPTSPIAEGTYNYRTLGIGFTDLGALMMMQGIPYDSERARAWFGALSAIMTGESYLTSTRLAEELGPFSKYERNKGSMMRVIRNHRLAAYSAKAEEYDKVNQPPRGIEKDYCPEYLLTSARGIWDEVVDRGEKYGFRNAQVSVTAPTGTIGLVMACDTTGIEPDFALVKHKKLAGGGYMRIINRMVPKALERLGYTKEQIDDITKYIIGRGGLPDVGSWVSIDSLTNVIEFPLSSDQIANIQDQLSNASDIEHAINSHTLGAEYCLKIGIPEEQINDFNIGSKILELMGYSAKDIEDTNLYVCGHQTIEGAPYVNEEHYPVFDCAMASGAGVRSISYDAHLKAMAAVQPFMSGGISKTINLPDDASIEDIEKCYQLAYQYGIKCVALYRDGSKLSQPLNTLSKTIEYITEDDEVVEVPIENIYVATRRKLPAKRLGQTHEFQIGPFGGPYHKIFLRTGEYEDGGLGEIFIDYAEEDAFARTSIGAFARSVSIGLQHGVPKEEYTSLCRSIAQDPSGQVLHPNVKVAKSIYDAIGKMLDYAYGGQDDAVEVPDALETSLTNGLLKKHIEASIDTARSIIKDKVDKSKVKATLEQCPNCGSADTVKEKSCETHCKRCDHRWGSCGG